VTGKIWKTLLNVQILSKMYFECNFN